MCFFLIMFNSMCCLLSMFFVFFGWNLLAICKYIFHLHYTHYAISSKFHYNNYKEMESNIELNWHFEVVW